MKDVQSLYDSIIKKMQRHAGLVEVEKTANDPMHLYHKGHLLAYKDIAERLICDFDCKATFQESESKNGKETDKN